jgi:hypothetical protein
MENVILYRLIDELRIQSRFAQFAFQNLKTSVHGLDPERVFFFVHSFLQHAANVNRKNAGNACGLNSRSRRSRPCS